MGYRCWAAVLGRRSAVVMYRRIFTSTATNQHANSDPGADAYTSP